MPVVPETSVLDSMPRGLPSRAKAAIKEIAEPEDKKHAETVIEVFASEFGAKWPKAVSKITSEKEILLTFYDYPAEHWQKFEDCQPDRVSLCAGQSEDRPDKGLRIEKSGIGDDL